MNTAILFLMLSTRAITAVPYQLEETVTDVPPLLTDVAASSGIPTLAISPNANVFLYAFTRAGQFRESLVLLAGATFGTDLMNLPQGRCISLTAAMPSNLGDGATLNISVEDGLGELELRQFTLDPAHVREHRSWLPIRIDVPDRTRNIRIRFAVGAGVRGDETADWIGLAAGPDAGCLFAEPAE
jgi:hypothetical protein